MRNPAENCPGAKPGPFPGTKEPCSCARGCACPLCAPIHPSDRRARESRTCPKCRAAALVRGVCARCGYVVKPEAEQLPLLVRRSGQ